MERTTTRQAAQVKADRKAVTPEEWQATLVKRALSALQAAEDAERTVKETERPTAKLRKEAQIARTTAETEVPVIVSELSVIAPEHWTPDTRAFLTEYAVTALGDLDAHLDATERAQVKAASQVKAEHAEWRARMAVVAYRLTESEVTTQAEITAAWFRPDPQADAVKVKAARDKFRTWLKQGINSARQAERAGMLADVKAVRGVMSMYVTQSKHLRAVLDEHERKGTVPESLAALRKAVKERADRAGDTPQDGDADPRDALVKAAITMAETLAGKYTPQGKAKAIPMPDVTIGDDTVSGVEALRNLGAAIDAYLSKLPQTETAAV